ncbi:HTH domain-containing protein [Perlabentimonas gracilis]|uniref:HTH domain-containing protein n=1 Tax=Perlabentimonas gracilis TaxID=2715279 RepID=UPI0014080110|nr:HTH domain-containing protein [Perlabentimonas gracilis]NHB70279.1 HTH domain-containing protein [Perlabentimonas gracilis]
MILKARDLVETLHQQIESRTTGTPAQLAQRLGISHRTLMRYIAQLREMGADIRFSLHRNTYYYATSLTFRFGYEPVFASDNSSMGSGEEG